MPDSTHVNTDSAAVLLDLAERQMTDQVAELDSLRTRAVTILSVASIVAGLLGSRIAAHPHGARVLVATWVALGLFTGSVVIAVVLLWPRNRYWHFAHFITPWLARLKEREVSRYDISFNLARGFESARLANKNKLNDYYKLLGLLCGLLGLQVVAWVVAIT